MRRGTVAFSSQPDLEPDGARRSLADIYKLHRRRDTEVPNRLGVFQRLFSLFGSRPASRKTSTASFTGAGENIPLANYRGKRGARNISLNSVRITGNFIVMPQEWRQRSEYTWDTSLVWCQGRRPRLPVRLMPKAPVHLIPVVAQDQ